MRRKGHDERTWFTFSYSPVRDEAGRIAGMFCACTETTEKVVAERRLAAESQGLRRLFHQAQGFMCVLRGREHVFEAARPPGARRRARGVLPRRHGAARGRGAARRDLLAREVDHRAKNALAVVQAALRLTKADDVPGYVAAVEGRVGALARAQTLLAHDRWGGADLRALLQAELEPFLGGGGAGADDQGAGPRVELAGPPVTVPAGAAQPLAMAVHELATNAVKHGALSAPGGRVSVAWRLDREPAREMLRVRWREAGGPPVQKPPERRGFGARHRRDPVPPTRGRRAAGLGGRGSRLPDRNPPGAIGGGRRRHGCDKQGLVFLGAHAGRAEDALRELAAAGTLLRSDPLTAEMLEAFGCKPPSEARDAGAGAIHVGRPHGRPAPIPWDSPRMRPGRPAEEFRTAAPAAKKRPGGALHRALRVSSAVQL
jgi:two-component sensor histidine kinase